MPFNDFNLMLLYLYHIPHFLSPFPHVTLAKMAPTFYLPDDKYDEYHNY